MKIKIFFAFPRRWPRRGLNTLIYGSNKTVSLYYSRRPGRCWEGVSREFSISCCARLRLKKKIIRTIGEIVIKRFWNSHWCGRGGTGRRKIISIPSDLTIWPRRINNNKLEVVEYSFFNDLGRTMSPAVYDSAKFDHPSNVVFSWLIWS